MIFSNFVQLNQILPFQPPTFIDNEWNCKYFQLVNGWYNPANREPINPFIFGNPMGYIPNTGYFILFSKIGPQFFIGYGNAEPIPKRLIKYLHLYGIIENAECEHPRKWQNYCRLRYHYFYPEAIDFDDVFVSFCECPNPNQQTRNQLVFQFKDHIGYLFRQGNSHFNNETKTINTFNTNSLNGNQNKHIHFAFPGNLNEIIQTNIQSLF
jgi:hypothetical protein